MTTYFVSRHAGAVDWVQEHSAGVDAFVTHLDVAVIRPGDKILGSLPVHLAAQVCAAGAQYWNLSFDLPAELRGQELTAGTLQQLGARLERYDITGPCDHGAQYSDTP